MEVWRQGWKTGDLPTGGLPFVWWKRVISLGPYRPCRLRSQEGPHVNRHHFGARWHTHFPLVTQMVTCNLPISFCCVLRDAQTLAVRDFHVPPRPRLLLRTETRPAPRPPRTLARGFHQLVQNRFRPQRSAPRPNSSPDLLELLRPQFEARHRRPDRCD